MLFIQINMPKHVFDITVALRKKAFSILFNDFRSSLLQDFLTINRSFTHSELDSESVWSLLCHIVFFISFTRLTEFWFCGL